MTDEHDLTDGRPPFPVPSPAPCDAEGYDDWDIDHGRPLGAWTCTRPEGHAGPHADWGLSHDQTDPMHTWEQT